MTNNDNTINKNLLIAFSSFLVQSDPNRFRMEEYAICYEQLKRVIPKNFDILFVDNTIKTIKDITNQRLISAIGETPCLFYDKNIGIGNKGLGELDMLIYVKKKMNLESYKMISYLTGRRFITCPYVFDRTNLCKKEILVGDQPLINVMNGFNYPMGYNVLGDSFFSMSSKKIIEYANFAEMLIYPKNIGMSIGSEQILHSFITKNNQEYEQLDYLGFIRNDWELVDRSSYSRRVENFQVI